MSISPTSQSCSAILFNLGEITFALPMNTVLRVVHRSQVESQNSDFLYLEQQPWEVLGLAALLERSQAQAQEHSPQALFYLLVQWSNPQGGVQRGAIAVDAPPVLLDLPLEQVHPLPPGYRERLGGVAQHMVAIAQAEQTRMIMLLELTSLALCAQGLYAQG